MNIWKTGHEDGLPIVCRSRNAVTARGMSSRTYRFPSAANLSRKKMDKKGDLQEIGKPFGAKSGNTGIQFPARPHGTQALLAQTHQRLLRRFLIGDWRRRARIGQLLHGRWRLHSAVRRVRLDHSCSCAHGGPQRGLCHAHATRRRTDRIGRTIPRERRIGQLDCLWSLTALVPSRLERGSHLSRCRRPTRARGRTVRTRCADFVMAVYFGRRGSFCRELSPS